MLVCIICLCVSCFVYVVLLCMCVVFLSVGPDAK